MIAADLAQYVECETNEVAGARRRSRQRHGPRQLAKNAATVAARFPPVNPQCRPYWPGSIPTSPTIEDASSETDIWAKQGGLQQLHARIEQQAGALAEAVPLALVRAYATELAAGMTIPNRPEATHHINAILSGHAKSLSEFVAVEGGVDSAPPAFPDRPGVSDALRYIAEFASLAGIVRSNA